MGKRHLLLIRNQPAERPFLACSISALLCLAVLLVSCSAPAGTASPAAETPPAAEPLCYSDDPSLDVDARVDLLLACMTLEEKIGQMTQVEKGSIQPGDITRYFIGSILSGGGGSPRPNTPAGWAKMVTGFQDEALATRLGIPLMYGVDAVHGHGNLYGATIFPHEIGLGAADDPDLMERIGRATATEMLATGTVWNFAPVVAVPQDIRWGRTYEAYGEDTDLVTRLGAAYIRGLQSFPPEDPPESGQTIRVLATPKHYLGDGGTLYGTSKTYVIDQGDMRVEEDVVRELYLPPYRAAVEDGAMSVMVSFSSWNGTKMHAQKYLITDVLKGELGFRGFVISDWGGIDQIDPGDYYASVVASINAGVDMNMVPSAYTMFIPVMKQAVDRGDIPIERVDDAVRRILRAKFLLGLFDRPYPATELAAAIRSPEHLNLAREAVRKSLVLLTNEGGALPLDKQTPRIFLAGDGAEDIGRQCGGWTIEWQGRRGNITTGTTILEAVEQAVSAETEVIHNRFGNFDARAPVGIVVVGEKPYTEGVGDARTLALSEAEIGVITRTRAQVDRLVVIMLSGRPLVITEQLPLADAWVAVWLPGTEAAGITDVLFGDYPFTGRLPYSWPRSDEQLPLNIHNVAGREGCEGPLFAFGYGLTIGQSAPVEACE